MRILLATLIVPLASIACSSAPPPPVEAPVAETASEEQHVTSSQPRMIYDVGAIDSAIAAKRFASLKPVWNDCFSEAHEKNAALSGKVTLSIRTLEDGSVKWAYVVKSDLGDRTVERCMIESVKEQNWGSPEDAKEGEIKEKTYGWEVDGDDVETAEPASASSVMPAIDKAKKKLAECKKDATSAFVATLYVAPGGKARDVGVAISDATGEVAVDCVVGVLAGLRYSNKSKHTTKVTLELP